MDVGNNRSWLYSGFKATTQKSTYGLTYGSISIALHATRACCGFSSLHGTPATYGNGGNCGIFSRGLTSTTIYIVNRTGSKYLLTIIRNGLSGVSRLAFPSLLRLAGPDLRQSSLAALSSGLSFLCYFSLSSLILVFA